MNKIIGILIRHEKIKKKSKLNKNEKKKISSKFFAHFKFGNRLIYCLFGFLLAELTKKVINMPAY